MSERVIEPQTAARYLRQILLTEIGQQGQGRICEAEAAVAGAGLRHEIASRYARRAGFRELAPGDIDLELAAPEALLSTQAAREVLAGSRASLAEMRRVVGIDEGGKAAKKEQGV